MSTTGWLGDEMKYCRLLLTLLLLLFAISALCADGMLLVPSHVLGSFSEQAQVAVVEMKPEGTVKVNLFITLHDSSGKSNEIYYLLPLQTMPDDFHMEETQQGDYLKQYVTPLDKIVFRAHKYAADAKKTILNSYDASAFLAGPVAFAGRWLKMLRDSRFSGLVYGGLAGEIGGGGSGSLVAPTLTIETDHVRAQLYPALDEEKLAALAQMPSLPPIAQKGVAGYRGGPFALVRMHTIPRPKEEPSEARPIWSIRAETPGVHFSFSQKLLAEGGTGYYNYPLATGQGWAKPIPLTQVCVVAPDTLNLEVNFPGAGLRERKVEWITDGIPRDERLACAADGRQVHMVTYVKSNATKDIKIVLHNEGQNALMAEVAKMRRNSGLAPVAFSLLGILSWLATFWLVARHSEYVRQRGKLRAFAFGWLMVVLPMILIGLLVTLCYFIDGLFNTYDLRAYLNKLSWFQSAILHRYYYQLSTPVTSLFYIAPVYVAALLCYACFGAEKPLSRPWRVTALSAVGLVVGIFFLLGAWSNFYYVQVPDHLKGILIILFRVFFVGLGLLVFYLARRSQPTNRGLFWRTLLPAPVYGVVFMYLGLALIDAPAFSFNLFLSGINQEDFLVFALAFIFSGLLIYRFTSRARPELRGLFWCALAASVVSGAAYIVLGREMVYRLWW